MFGEESSKQSVVGTSNAQADQNSVANVNNPAFTQNVNFNLSDLIAPSRISDTNSTLPPIQHTIHHLPPRNPDFIGRQEMLTSLYDTFTTGKATAQAISGMGGIGKTQVALAYAYKYRNDYQIILWTNC